MCIWLGLMVQCTSGSFGVAGVEDGSDSEGSYSEILIEATNILGIKERFKGRRADENHASAVGHRIRIQRETQGQKPYVEGRDPAEESTI